MYSTDNALYQNSTNGSAMSSKMAARRKTRKIFNNILTTGRNSKLFKRNVALNALYKIQDSHRLKKYLNIQDCLERSLKIKFALKNTFKGLEKSLNFTIYRRIQQCFWRPESVSYCGAFIWCSICCTK